MSMLENIPGIGEALKLGTKLTNILDRLATDAQIREEMRKTGHVDGTFTLSHYRVTFTVFDESQTPVIDAQIQE